MHVAKTFSRSQSQVPATLFNRLTCSITPIPNWQKTWMIQLKMTRLTSQRQKDWTKKESLTLLFSNCLCMSKTAVATQYKQKHMHADSEHTPLSNPDETEKQESYWKVCLWPETYWTGDMKGWVNGCHRVCDWLASSRERLFVEAGDSRLGANQGEK